MNVAYAELARALAPETALVIGALAVLAMDLAWLRSRPAATRTRAAAALGALAVAVAIGLAARTDLSGTVAAGAFTLDALARAFRIGVLGLVLLALGVSAGARPQRHPAEYVALLLFAATGFSLMAATSQLLTAFLALELASLSLYVLTGFDKARPESAEAALKYFLFGGLSSAFLLFGFSLLYGLAGAIDFPSVTAVLCHPSGGMLPKVALVMVLTGLGFKVAAAPFHFWAPDVYQGAPAPSAALISSASKLAGVALFVRLFWPAIGAGALTAELPAWIPGVAMLAGFSIMLGNLAALAQTNVRRLLAYSAVAHSGALMLGIIIAGSAGLAPLFYYAATYGIAVLGVFGVIAVVGRTGACQRLEDLAGLRQRSPLLAGCLLVFVLSLAGIPPLAGFFGKFLVFAAALRLDGITGLAGQLAVLAILFSVVALYYYLLVLKQALVAAPADDAGMIAVPPVAAATLLLAGTLTVLLGLFPSLLLGWF